MLPVRPSVTTTSARPLTRSPPSTFPTNSNAGTALGGAPAQIGVHLDDQGAAASLLLAVGEQADPGTLDAEHEPGQRRPHEGELDEVLAPCLGVGADIEQGHRVAGHRQRNRQGGPEDAPRRA